MKPFGAPAAGVVDAQPSWFDTAVSHPRTAHHVLAAGVPVHVTGWNADELGKPPLLFVHGFRANAHWWDHIAPFFVQRHRVFALELSGMGRSGRRATYARSDFVADIVSAVQWLRSAAHGLPLAVVGHSYGGSRLLEACAHHPGLIEHAIVLDSPVPLAGDAAQRPARRGRVEPDEERDSILARFRLVPEQPALTCVRRYVAERSIVAVPQSGWRWQFDPGILEAVGGTTPRDDELRSIAARVDVVRGEYSTVVSADMATRIATLLRRGRGPVEIPQAHHHLMFDEPLALIGVLKALLA
jgi:pimeloyl-ACP methyl ester carboxylesterase